MISDEGKTTLTLYFTSFKAYFVKTNYNFAQFKNGKFRLFLNHPGMVLASSESPENVKYKRRINL